MSKARVCFFIILKCIIKQMKKNLFIEKIIAVAFIIFICGLPLASLAKNMMPKKDVALSEGDNVLDGG